MKTVDIFYTPIGSGHKIAADAIDEALKKRETNIVVNKINIFDFSKVKIVKTIPKIDTRSKFTGPFYNILWGTENVSKLTGKLEAVYRNNFSELESFLKESKPEVAISTQSFAANLISIFKKRGGFKFYNLAVLTDFRAHPYWPKEGIDFYFASSFVAQSDLVRRGIDPKKIIVTGIPLRDQFLNDSIKKLTTKNPIFEILILAGAIDTSVYKNVAKEIKNIVDLAKRTQIKITVICGKNETLRNDIKEVANRKGYNSRIRALGFVQNMEPLLARHDVLVTKPGGLICAEAIASTTPLILLSTGAYGQEKGNLDFLINHGVALEAKSIDQLEKVLSFLSKNLNFLAQMRQNFASLSQRQKEASGNIAEHALKTIFKRR